MIFLRCLLCLGGIEVIKVTGGSDLFSSSNAINKPTWGFLKTSRYPRLNIIFVQKMWKYSLWDFWYIANKKLSTDEDDHSSDYKSHVLTNLDSDIFQSTISQAPIKKSNKTVIFALRTWNVVRKRMKIVHVSRTTKVEKDNNISKITNQTNLCFYK